MTLNDFIKHLEAIRERTGGDIPVYANDIDGEDRVFNENSVYTIDPAGTGQRVLIDP
jgi:hypothetical protein